MKILDWYASINALGIIDPNKEGVKHGFINNALVRIHYVSGEKRYVEFQKFEIFEGQPVMLSKKRGDRLADIDEVAVLEFPWIFFAKGLVPRGTALVAQRKANVL